MNHKFIRREASRKLSLYNQCFKYYTLQVFEAQNKERALTNCDGSLAWQFLKRRSDDNYEYERIKLIPFDSLETL